MTQLLCRRDPGPMLERLTRHRPVAIQTSLALMMGLLFSLAFGARAVSAQEPTTSNEFWPEIDVYINLKPKLRLYLLGTVSKSVEDGDLRNASGFEAQFGAHIDYLPNEHVILRTGYRFGTSVGQTGEPFKEHRLLTEQTLRKLLPGGLMLSDRNREDFRFVNGDFSFRYRNRVTLEREFHLFRKRPVTPYVSGEIFYDTRSSAWNRNRFGAGVQISLRRSSVLKMLMPKHQVILDLYYMRQNDSRSDSPHVNAAGAALTFYF